MDSNGDCQHVGSNISVAYDVLPGGVALRGLFLINQKRMVRHQVVNDLGRNLEETLRVVVARQFFEENGEFCPANWQRGAETIKRQPESSREFFSKEYAQVG